LPTTICLILINIITTFNVSIFALSDETNQMEQNIVKATYQTLISPSSNETGQAIPIQKMLLTLGETSLKEQRTWFQMLAKE